MYQKMLWLGCNRLGLAVLTCEWERTQLLPQPPAAVLQGDRITQSASSLRLAISEAVR